MDLCGSLWLWFGSGRILYGYGFGLDLVGFVHYCGSVQVIMVLVWIFK